MHYRGSRVNNIYNMILLWTFGIAFLMSALSSVCDGECIYHNYCVVGAGPGGLQMGHFLQTKGRDYVVFERSNTSGSFYVKYPRHRKLISINKRYTGQSNPEFNMRHDWNSLLSDDVDLRITKYSEEIFPHADVLVEYLNDFTAKMQINVQYNTDIRHVRQMANGSAPGGRTNVMEDQNGQCYTCRTLVMANGVSVPKQVEFEGIELTQPYDSVSIDPRDYEGKSVLVLGRGNSAFEFAESIFHATNFIHMLSRSRLRLAWSSHYVGDLRAINNGLLDTYQLKALDGLAEVDFEDLVFTKQGDKIVVQFKDDIEVGHEEDNMPFRCDYDAVITALGFIYDHGVFNHTDVVMWNHERHRASKYPKIGHNYELKRLPGVFVAGTAAHSLDFRKSAGGFIHGFRYTTRALHKLLEWRYEANPWPSVTVPRSQVLHHLVRRINEASGIYQMFHFLGDVMVFSEDLSTVSYLEEFPVRLLHQLPEQSGLPVHGPVVALVMEYGKDFSGPAADVFREDRAYVYSQEAIYSNFLHPVLYFYKKLPSKAQMEDLTSKEVLPRPDGLHAICEDFLTDWTAPITHLLPLRRFFENMLQTDLREFTAETCFMIGMTMTSLPETCNLGYISERGLSATEVIQQLLSKAQKEIPLVSKSTK